MDNYEVHSDIPVMHFCEWCYATLNQDGTCPTEGCIHNDLMNMEGKKEEQYYSREMVGVIMNRARDKPDLMNFIVQAY